MCKFLSAIQTLPWPRRLIRYSFALLVFGFPYAASSQTVIGVLNSETKSPEIPASVQPLFQFDGKKWKAIGPKTCKKLEISDWQIFSEGESKEKLKGIPERSKQDKKKCRFPVVEVPALMKPQVVVGSEESHPEDPSGWKLIRPTPKEIVKLSLPKDTTLVKAYQNKDKEHFFVLQVKPKSIKKSKKNRFISGFWDSSKKEKWTTKKSSLDFLDAGDYNGDGSSKILLIEGESGETRKYYLFSSEFKQLAEKKP